MDHDLSTWWIVTIDALTSPGEELEDDSVSHLLVEFPRPISATSTTTSITATIPSNAQSPVDALNDVCRDFVRWADKAELPELVYRSVKVMSDQAVEDALGREEPPLELLGVNELATELGVSKQRASELWRKPPAGFPPPVTVLKSGPVWRRSSILDFLQTWERKPGRRPALKTVEVTDNRTLDALLASNEADVQNRLDEVHKTLNHMTAVDA